jgi:ABC-type amino acid transport substrate-binding protein
MKRLAVALALALAAAGAHAQKSDTSSGGRKSKARNSAGARIGGSPTNPAEAGTSAEGRARAGYDVGMASATAGGRTDTGPVGIDIGRLPVQQTPSVAYPTPEEIVEAQKRGRIRDRGVPDWVRGPALHELEVPNPFQVQLVVKNPYRHRQDDLQP